MFFLTNIMDKGINVSLIIKTRAHPCGARVNGLV